MKKLLTSSLLAAGALLGAHLVEKRQSPWTFAQEMTNNVKVKKAQFDSFNQKRADVQKKLAAFQATLTAAQPTLEAISREVEKFQFKTQHRLDQIKETADHMQQVADKLQKKD